MKYLGSLLGLAIAASLTGCGAEAPETKLQEAANDLREARADRSDAAEAIEDAAAQLRDERAEFEAAERALHQARKKLRETQKRLDGERKDLDRVATDTAMFRLLQRKLLDDPELTNLGLTASVFEARATLDGEGATPEQKQKAEQIARAIPGVTSVVNRIEVSKTAKK